jgi:translation elongation factor EF-Tu-like GTPase
MIHLNTGNDSSKHEWVTEEEFKKRFHDLHKSLNEPVDDTLRKVRMKKRVTIREMIKATGLGADVISRIERGKIRDQKLIDTYIEALNKF